MCSEKIGDFSVEIFLLCYVVVEDCKIEYCDDEIEVLGIVSIFLWVFSDVNVVVVGDELGKLCLGL